MHRDLAALPFYFTITTTPDSMLINALVENKENKKEPVSNWYNFNGENPGIRPFDDNDIDRRLFFGRDTEKEALLHKIPADITQYKKLPPAQKKLLLQIIDLLESPKNEGDKKLKELESSMRDVFK